MTVVAGFGSTGVKLVQQGVQDWDITAGGVDTTTTTLGTAVDTQKSVLSWGIAQDITTNTITEAVNHEAIAYLSACDTITWYGSNATSLKDKFFKAVYQVVEHY